MENRLVDKIKDAKLTKTEVIIAKFFLNNESKVCFMTLGEIAKELNISDTSIMRFSRTLGYGGFNDLQKDVQEMISNRIQGESSLYKSLSARFEETAVEFTENDITKKAFDQVLKNLQKTLEQNSMQKYNKLVDMLMQGKRKYIIGFRGAKGSVVHFARTLRYITENVIEITSADTSAFELLSGITKEDVVVIISFSRYGKADVLIRDFLVKKEVPFCAITDRTLSPVAKSSELLLLTETKGMSFFNSTVGTIFLIEMISSILGHKLGESARNSIDELDVYLKEFNQS